MRTVAWMAFSLLLGPKTAAFLGDSLRMAIVGLRNELLDATTQSALDSIISRSLTTLSQAYRDKMQPLVHRERGILGKEAWVTPGSPAHP